MKKVLMTVFVALATVGSAVCYAGITEVPAVELKNAISVLTSNANHISCVFYYSSIGAHIELLNNETGKLEKNLNFGQPVSEYANPAMFFPLDKRGYQITNKLVVVLSDGQPTCTHSVYWCDFNNGSVKKISTVPAGEIAGVRYSIAIDKLFITYLSKTSYVVDYSEYVK